MNPEKKNKLAIYALIIIGIVGVLVSGYLLYGHYVEEGSTICDINSKISCSLVNSSIFSELFNVPVALLGMFWFLVFLYLVWKSATKDNISANRLYYWVILGLFFIIYMIYGEYALKAICPACTLVHLLIIVSFFLVRILPRNKIQLAVLIKDSIKFISILLLLVAAIFLFFNYPHLQENHDNLAKCLTNNGAVMYSSYLCSHCQDQKELFGDSLKFIAEIECHPDGPNSQYQLCIEKNITATPTWVIERNGQEIKRNVGLMSLEELSSWGECSLG